MDPALLEAVRRGPAEREIEAAALVAAEIPLPPDLRVVAAFGEIVTGRLRVDRIAEVRRHPAIRSLKAARTLGPADATPPADPGATAPLARGVPGATGAGCVLAFLDWGCDFAHPSFRGAGGRTRLRALWDQRGPGDGNRFGYGRVLGRERIDAALAAPDPYAALAYHPGRRAAHGTHVMDIAAGNGSLPGSARGVAPEAELVFVHLATALRTGEGDLGDSVRILEALDFVRAVAGPDPFVVNMSLGRTAGDHTGRSMVERGMDALLEEAPGRAIVQSCGNYFGKRLHTAGTLSPGRTQTLEWVIEPADRTLNELEIWYPGRDRLAVELAGPDGASGLRLRLGERGPIEADGRTVGFAYHREDDPLNGDHQVDLFLEPDAPKGTWEVRLVAEDVVDGRWHAWIERDPAGPDSQSRFRPDVATDDATIGTIATGRRTIVVGAVDPGTGAPAPFSSRGPSRDGRMKPDVCAPGVGIVAACSTPPGAAPGSGGLVEMSGTSMASPHVAGLVAALLGRAPRPLNVAETRLLVLGTATALEGDPMRTGAGLLDTEAAIAALDCMFRERKEAMSRQNGAAPEPRSSWSPVGTPDFEREMEDAFGPMEAYDVVGLPGGPLRAPIRAGDLLVRADAGGQPLVARMTAPGLHPPDVLPEGAEADGDGEGWYAEAITRTPGGWAGAPAYRQVADHRRLVQPGQLVLRPARGFQSPALFAPPAGPRPTFVAPPVAYPTAVAYPPAIAYPTPVAEEPSVVEEPISALDDDLVGDVGDDLGDDREDAPKTTRYDFPGDVITVPVIQVDSSTAEQEVEAAINTLGRWMLPFATSYLGGLDNFETNMVFASDQEAQPRYFDVALKEIGKAIVEKGLKVLEDVPVLGQVVGVAKSLVVGWYEESERASKAAGDRRIAEYVVDSRNRINQLVRSLTQAIDASRPKLLADFRAAVARSIAGQGTNRVLTGDAAVYMKQLKKAVEAFKASVPTPERVQQLVTEKFMGPQKRTGYVSHGARIGAILYLSVNVYHDKSASKPWKLQGVGSSWEIPTRSPHPDRLATSLRSAMQAQRKEVWRCNLPKSVNIRIEEEVPLLNEYRDGAVLFSDDPAAFSVESWSGKPQFAEAWNVAEIRAAALRVDALSGADS